MSGSLAIPNDISAQSGPQIPASYLDENWETIAAYVNSREVTFGPISARPPAGIPGRWWYAIDQRSLYVDSGTGWILLSGTGETGGTDFGAAYLQLQEILDPAAGPMDTIRLYAKDDGAGNTILVYKRADGTIIKLDGTTTGVPPHDHTGFAPATHDHGGAFAPATHTHPGLAGIYGWVRCDEAGAVVFQSSAGFVASTGHPSAGVYQVNLSTAPPGVQSYIVQVHGAHISFSTVNGVGAAFQVNIIDDSADATDAPFTVLVLNAT